ncbi:laminin subunit alpha-like, partial [Paramuricea clavata]
GGLSFEFRTFASNGILFYSANNAQIDFISCYLQDGKVTFGFNTGSEDIFLSTDNVVNDGTWKKVTIYRDKVKAQLTVDGIDVNAVGNPGATIINGIPYLYFGGYKTEVLKRKINAKSRVPISACFRRLMWHSGMKFPKKPVKEQFVSKCYNEQQEKSVYFAGINSYMIATEAFFVGRKKLFSMDIKPQNMTGLIFALVDQKRPENGDFVVLELNDGSVVVRVQNGDGIMQTSWTPLDGQTLCDNKWHKIVVSKVEKTLSLQVDTNPPSKVKQGTLTVANVKDQFFLGGIPANVRSSGINVRSSYQGCLKNFRVTMSSVVELFNPASMFGDISMFGCPIAD